MGRVTVAATIENLNDVLNAQTGVIPPDQVRRVEVSDARVDTGVSGLLMPARLIRQLGLLPFRKKPHPTMTGDMEVTIYATARLTVQGRECPMDVGEIDDRLPVTIGQIPLEAMDWVVDPKGQKLIGNPEHGGEHIMEALTAI
jgi:predicted aspartyl protease